MYTESFFFFNIPFYDYSVTFTFTFDFHINSIGMFIVRMFVVYLTCLNSKETILISTRKNKGNFLLSTKLQHPCQKKRKRIKLIKSFHLNFLDCPPILFRFDERSWSPVNGMRKI